MATPSTNLEPRTETADATRAPASGGTRAGDLVAGGALGAFLGLLIGLSGTPIVSTVVTALIALLAGLFGLSDKAASPISPGGARRLAAFAILATVATPIATWMRAHEVLSPSVAEQKRDLAAMGITSDKDQVDLLRYQRFGFLPPGLSLVGKDAAPLWQAGKGILYAAPAAFCNDLARVKDRAPEDFFALFETGDDEIKEIGRIIKGLPVERQKAVLAAAPIYLCRRH